MGRGKTRSFFARFTETHHLGVRWNDGFRKKKRVKNALFLALPILRTPAPRHFHTFGAFWSFGNVNVVRIAKWPRAAPGQDTGGYADGISAPIADRRFGCFGPDVGCRADARGSGSDVFELAREPVAAGATDGRVTQD